MERIFNVLLANENTEESNLISEKLTNDKLSCVVQMTTSGKEAIEFASKIDFDLVVLDLVLADEDGFEVIEFLKNQGSKAKIIVRPSGTEPVIRLYVESSDNNLNEFLIEKLEKIIKNASC